MKKNLHLLIAVALALAAGFLVWFFMNLNSPSVQVVTVKHNLTIGAVLTKEDLQTKMTAKSAVPPDAVRNPAAAIGKTLNYPLLPGDILRGQHITAGAGSLVARLASVAPGKVVVDLPAEAAKGLIGLQIGDIADIYGEITIPDGSGQTATVVGKVAAGATILYAPNGDGSAIIVACTPQEESQVAQVLGSGKTVTLFLHPHPGPQTKEARN